MKKISFEETDIAGKKYGRLEAIHFSHVDKRNYYWLFRCDCGKEKVIRKNCVMSGKTSSCGCLSADVNKKMFTKHNMSKSRLYTIRQGVISRCYSERNTNYKNYGEKGISVCREWLESFELFKDWAVNNGYQDNLFIDRIDVYGDYSPENCRWISFKEQQRNRRNTVYVEENGEKITLCQWCEDNGKNRDVSYARIKKGWSIEKIKKTPERRLKLRGEDR